MSLCPEHFAEAALLLRLVETGEAVEGKQSKTLLERFQNAGWIELGSRRNAWKVSVGGILPLQVRLAALWPEHQDEANALRRAGFDPRLQRDLGQLSALKRRSIDASGRTLNRRNWNAAAGLGPKRSARITDETVRLTKDAITRFRPNRGLSIRIGESEVDLWATSEVLTECAIPERAWLKDAQFLGLRPRAIVTSENLGPYIDLPLPADVMAVFSPGSDIQPALEVLHRLPEVPWIHFGDLDPEGLQIADQIARATDRPPRLFIPDFCAQYLRDAQKSDVDWPTNGPAELESTLVLELRRQKRGLFQEVFMLDERLAHALEQAVKAISRASVVDQEQCPPTSAQDGRGDC